MRILKFHTCIYFFRPLQINTIDIVKKLISPWNLNFPSPSFPNENRKLKIKTVIKVAVDS